MNKQFHIQTFGCQMNEHDSETIAGMLLELGIKEADTRSQADVLIINTCSVRENADKRFFGTLGQLKKIKETRPETIVAICGCMMQQQHIIDTVKSKYPWVDLIFGTHNIHSFPSLLTNVINERGKIVDVWDDGGDIMEGLPSRRQYPFKAFVNIMYGCNNFCSYCIVPYTRGRERSRKPEEILREIKDLVAGGVKEVTLLGQNVNSYGRQGEFDLDFAGLIRKIDEIPGLERIRFMTSHPKDLSPQLIQCYRDCKHLAPHVHLPVQSGSSRILSAMNRFYDREQYLALTRELKQALPGIAITTDLIVGFPGETEEDFLDTLDLVRQVGFDSAYTFLYSVRKGTPAESFPDQVPEDVKHQRFNRLVELLNQLSLEKNLAYIGKLEKVLVEGPSKTDPSRLSGRTGSGKLVNFPGSADFTGQIVQVLITEGKTFSLSGTLQPQQEEGGSCK